MDGANDGRLVGVLLGRLVDGAADGRTVGLSVGRIVEGAAVGNGVGASVRVPDMKYTYAEPTQQK